MAKTIFFSLVKDHSENYLIRNSKFTNSNNLGSQFLCSKYPLVLAVRNTSVFENGVNLKLLN